MAQWEAWTITALGMAVVFIGLVACIAFIRLFGRIAQHVTWGEGGHGHGSVPAEAPAPVAAADAPPSAPVPGDVLAVIAVVLELERKLYMNKPGARVTIRRPSPIA